MPTSLTDPAGVCREEEVPYARDHFMALAAPECIRGIRAAVRPHSMSEITNGLVRILGQIQGRLLADRLATAHASKGPARKGIETGWKALRAKSQLSCRSLAPQHDLADRITALLLMHRLWIGLRGCRQRR